ncbi:MAG: GNAT family N-acetyltransferase [Alphaproteobacteria bacterium]|nr:GNAT family N-acetyltransferase [Alphaproteobacteria bacterium]
MAAPETYKRDSLFLDKTPIETERLYLRPFEEGDAHAMWLMLSNPNVLRFIPREVATDEQTEKVEFLNWLRGGERLRFFYAVTWKDTVLALKDGMLGWVMMRPTEDGRFVEVGYWFREEFWGMGLATEAGHAAMAAGQANLKVPDHDLYAFVLQGNEGSHKVLTKLGLEHRQDAVVDGKAVWEFYGPGATPYEETVRGSDH